MVGRENYKPLSFSVFSWNFDLMSTTWVVAIVENEKMIEYVDLLYKLLFDSFWCCDKLQLLQWLWTIVGYFSVMFLLHALLCEGIVTFPKESLWYIDVLFVIMMPSCLYYVLSTPSSLNMWTCLWNLVFAWGQARSKLGGVDTSILHHVFMLIFIALWTVIIHCGTIFMPFLSYFARFIWRGRIQAAGILDSKRSKS